MMKLKNILNEGKQVGNIYHYTSLEVLFNIMNDNSLRSGKFENDNSISFTRDKFFGTQRRAGIDVDIRIIFDGDKLSNKYKIQPYQFSGSDKISVDNKEWSQSVGDEQEERLYLGDNVRSIDNVGNYIIGIEFPKKLDTLRFVLAKITPFSVNGWGTKDLYIKLNTILKKCVNAPAFSECVKTSKPLGNWWNSTTWTMKDLVRLVYDDSLFYQDKIKAHLPDMAHELSTHFDKPVTFTMET